MSDGRFTSETGAAAGKVAKKFDPAFIPIARKVAAIGATDIEIADILEVSVRSIYRWKVEHPEFGEALKVGKDVADDRVEASLFRKATGYSYESEKIFCDKGFVVRATTVEHIPPSDVACIFWLKNRRPADWRDKVDHEHTGKDGGEIMAKVTVEAVMAEMRRLDDDC